MSQLPTVTVSKSMLYSKDTSLRQPCRAIDVNDPADLALAQSAIAEMFKALFSDPSGVALAAPQVGIQLRIAVISYNEQDDNEQKLFALINPEITSFSEDTEEENEICLSVPNLTGKVSRHKRLEVTAHDVIGQPITLEATGFFAKVIQHELDHLNGILYVDRVETELQNVPDFPERRLEPTLKRLGLGKKKETK